MNQTPRFGAEVKRLRLALTLRQRHLATQIGVTAGFISLLENDLCDPPSEGKIGAIAVALGVEKDFLMALAQRIPPDVEEIVKTHPHTWAMVRAAVQ